MGGDSVLGALGSIVNTVFLVISVYIYFALLRQVASRPSPSAVPATHRTFGLPEAVIALFLAVLFLFTSLGAANAPQVNLRTRDLIDTAVLEFGLVAFIAVFLRLRRFDLAQITGIARLTFRRAFLIGFVLLIVAYPLIAVADWITARVLGASASSRQGIVELFSGSPSLEQRVLIILLAVAVAPLAEEFIFRFFLYGVLRRYAGRLVALVISALLFAAVHAHLPSFAPLFVLGACFTLAYEWSGSLLVSMTMHSIFNSLTLLALAFPNTFEQ
ncbi:MAG: CPBP family intramembrane metalloprotease [Verrucomicrobia bacterium]|nr:CPBP family intramembrane metalloprotease [Verrucomicrobiota bacterium]